MVETPTFEATSMDVPDLRAESPSLVARFKHVLRGPRILLLAVGLVVVVVSLPLLRSLALKENELDAMRALDLMGREVFAGESVPSTVGELIRGDRDLSTRLPDTRLLEGGRVMFHHGYLFDLVPTENGGRVLRAWPLAHGRTGLGAFWTDAPDRLLGHPNAAATWSGLGAAPPTSPPTEAEASREAPPAAVWRPLSQTRRRSSGI